MQLLKKQTTRKGINKSKIDICCGLVNKFEVQEIWSMTEISFRVLSNKFEHILRDNTDILFDRLDKEKEQKKMQRILNRGNRGNDQWRTNKGTFGYDIQEWEL